ncbi:hypothetical protein HYT56_05845 [Candidatus Woesearchaeota archaeon]|nr:hypothetical protein [Candidatus Woesearchaeota archaeon]
MKKPKFIQQDTNRKKSLKLKWKKPRGIHSKLREKRAGHRKNPSQGYRSPRSIRYFVAGMKINIINNIDDLGSIKEGAALLSSRIGAKKKLQILSKAKDLKIKVLNVKNIDEYISSQKEKFEKRKQEKKSKQLDKKKSKEKAVKESKKKEEEQKSEEKTDKQKPASYEQKESTQAVADAQQKQQQIIRPNAPMKK